jgi:hypothetical protein
MFLMMVDAIVHESVIASFVRFRFLAVLNAGKYIYRITKRFDCSTKQKKVRLVVKLVIPYS